MMVNLAEWGIMEMAIVNLVTVQNYCRKIEVEKNHLPTAVSRNCGAWDLSELVIFETKFCLYL